MRLLKNLKGDVSAKPRDTFLFYYRRNSLEAVRHGDWKLFFALPGCTTEGFKPGKDGQSGGGSENFNHTGGLYDLRRDPGERNNVQFDFPEVTAKLTKIAQEGRLDLGDDLTDSPGKTAGLLAG